MSEPQVERNSTEGGEKWLEEVIFKNRITEQQLNEIEQREFEATPGPWYMQNDELYGHISSDLRVIFGGERHEGYIDADDPDAIFTIHAREDIPKLITEIRYTQRELDLMKIILDSIQLNAVSRLENTRPIDNIEARFYLEEIRDRVIYALTFKK